MTAEQPEQQNSLSERMAEEDKILQRTDEDGNSWTKAYFGGGSHFKNWLSQIIEVKGEENVQIEEANPRGFQCYEESGEKLYRIWVKDTDVI